MMRMERVVNWLAMLAVLLCAASLLVSSARAEDGYDLWLRYAPLAGLESERLEAFDPVIMLDTSIRQTPTTDAAITEIQAGLTTMLGRPLHRSQDGARSIRLVCGENEAQRSGAFKVVGSADGIQIKAPDDLGCLYGSFALLRELSLGADPASINLDQTPAMPLRLLNHWDNPDGHVERGYAGRSIFDWWHLPEKLDRRMIDYARASASIGINGAVVNNVNARAYMLEPRYIAKLRRLADAWRPYGIRVYLSARFSAPRDIGGLDTADPHDAAVRIWWQSKADEIYAEIPDFGGFLVKANSEGQPGPQDYGRTHADGANMLAHAIGPRGVVIWRAFIYSAEDETDRAKQAYAEFVPLDGQFADNVIIQVKNGPIDFQPREPFHPMFGAMPNTRLMLEAQIAKEYLGFASHLAYLAPMWREVLDADTGRGGTVAQTIAPAGMAGVANTGSDRNWSGSHFDQANWYAFGRIAWDPALSSEAIAREWAGQTFSGDAGFLERAVPMMLDSRQAVVDYMTPLGLAHLMGTGHHYGPAPWVCDLSRPEWNPCYYHKADRHRIGFDRTATGSNALAQYAPAATAQWSDAATMDEDFLLWFHHVPWNHRMQSGRTLWQEMVYRYDRGVEKTTEMDSTWQDLEAYVDPQRHAEVAAMLKIQQREARWWRDASLAYWQSVNGLPLPAGTRVPENSLEHYQTLIFPEAPGQ